MDGYMEGFMASFLRLHLLLVLLQEASAANCRSSLFCTLETVWTTFIRQKHEEPDLRNTTSCVLIIQANVIWKHNLDFSPYNFHLNVYCYHVCYYFSHPSFSLFQHLKEMLYETLNVKLKCYPASIFIQTSCVWVSVSSWTVFIGSLPTIFFLPAGSLYLRVNYEWPSHMF